MVAERCGVGGHVQGNMFALPIYLAEPASSIAKSAARSTRAGWRYVYLAQDEKAGADAIMDFYKAGRRDPVLRSLSRGTKPRALAKTLQEIETEMRAVEVSYYVQMLIIPKSELEIVWFKDARRNNPQDKFKSLGKVGLGISLKDEPNARLTNISPLNSN